MGLAGGDVSSAGKWEIKVSQGGHPAWCELRLNDVTLARVHHEELRDLEYAVSRAIVECRNALPPSHKHEMD